MIRYSIYTYNVLKKEIIIMKLISLLLAVSLTLLCFTGCMTDEQAADVYVEVVQSIVEDMMGGGYDPSEGDEVPSDLFECTYTEADYNELCDAIAQLERIAIEGKSLLEVTNAGVRVDYLMNKLQDYTGVANVVYFASMEDEDKALYETLNEYGAQASALINDAYKAIYLSDSGAKDIIFADFTEAELEALVNSEGSNIKKYNDVINKTIEDFFALDSTADDFEETVNEMYVTFVENGNLLAKEYGYDSYYEYAAAEGYMRDYEVDKDEYRQYVIDYIVPVLLEKFEEFMESASNINPFAGMAYTRLAMDADYAMESGYIEGLIDTFDGDIKETAGVMFDGAHILWGDEDSYQAACTLPLSCYGEAVCYFADGYYGALSTVAHEMGHFISMYHYGADGGSYDFLEVHSQATEVMLLGYLEQALDAAVYDIYASDKIITLLGNIVVATIVDEFEDRIYHSEKAVTVQEIEAVIDGICKKYGEEVCELFQIRSYIKTVIIQSPVYYISYATSGLCTLALYCKLQDEGYEAAYESYEKLQRGPLGVTFLESIDYAVLPSPFEKETFELIADTLCGDASAEAAA